MTSILLKSPSKEFIKYILKIQSEMKIEKGVGQYSMEKTIYKIVSDYKSLIEKKG